jgi:hypothetical protein
MTTTNGLNMVLDSIGSANKLNKYLNLRFYSSIKAKILLEMGRKD